MEETCFYGTGIILCPCFILEAMPNMKSPDLLREYSLASMGRISMKAAFCIDCDKKYGEMF